ADQEQRQGGGQDRTRRTGRQPSPPAGRQPPGGRRAAVWSRVIDGFGDGVRFGGDPPGAQHRRMLLPPADVSDSRRQRGRRDSDASVDSILYGSFRQDPPLGRRAQAQGAAEDRPRGRGLRARDQGTVGRSTGGQDRGVPPAPRQRGGSRRPPDGGLRRGPGGGVAG